MKKNLALAMATLFLCICISGNASAQVPIKRILRIPGAGFINNHPVITATVIGTGLDVAARECDFGPAPNAGPGAPAHSRRPLAEGDIAGGVQKVAAQVDDAIDGVTVEQRSNETYALKRVLNQERAANGESENPENCEAHHIVPQAEMRPWAIKYVKESRMVLMTCAISIHDVENGVYLPGAKPGPSQCEGIPHRNMHSKAVYERIAQRLTAARDFGGCPGVRNELAQIKAGLIARIAP